VDRVDEHPHGVHEIGKAIDLPLVLADLQGGLIVLGEKLLAALLFDEGVKGQEVAALGEHGDGPVLEVRNVRRRLGLRRGGVDGLLVGVAALIPDDLDARIRLVEILLERFECIDPGLFSPVPGLEPDLDLGRCRAGQADGEPYGQYCDSAPPTVSSHGIPPVR
jgi:hypothetical protein